MRQRSSITDIFPERLSVPVKRVFDSFSGDIYEIRLIENRNVFFCTSSGLKFLGAGGVMSAHPSPNGLTVHPAELEEITERAMGYSGFAHEEELRECYLTRPDGTRIGIAFSGSTGTLHAGRVTSLNIRLPVVSPDIRAPGLDNILFSGGGLLIAGAPNSGKTTLLRYCCRALSDGASGGYRKVCAIDERGELSGGGGIYDLGACTDVIAGRRKSEAILIALRLMSPDIIVCDEIGSCEETRSILEGLNSGVSFVATMHAAELGQLILRRQFRTLFDENVFSNVVFLSQERKGTVDRVYTYREVANEIRGSGSAFRRSSSDVFDCQYPQEKKSAAAVYAF